MTAKAIARLERGLEDELGVPVALERPSNPEHGDYATNAAMRAAPMKRKLPMEIAEELRVVASGLPGVKDAAVAPPGFVNLQLDPAWYGEALGEILAAGADYGAGSAAEPEKVQVEFVSANPTGPLTVASARNAAYGDSVARLLDFAGNTVEREFYVNDGGAQIDLFHQSVDARRRGEEPPPDGYQGDYVGELAELDTDPVKVMEERIRETLERFRVHMDLWVHQSEMEPLVDEALAEIELYEKEGARWLATTEWGDDKDRVVLRSDGRPTYFAVDVPHMRLKWNRGHERLIYVLGADHHGYIARLKAIAGALGRDPGAGRDPHLPARPPDRGRPGAQGVEATGGRRLPRRASRRDRRRRGPLAPAFAWPRAGDGHRRRPRARAHRQEPGLLRPVRARPDRGHPAKRRGEGVLAGARGPGRNPRSASSSSGSPSSPRSSPRRPSVAARTPSRRTPSASPTTSTASTTTTACSRARRSRSASLSARQPRP